MPIQQNDKTIFNAARKIEDREERQKYLTTACQNDLEQLKQVTALLSGFESNSQFLESPAVSQQPIDYESESPGTIIGPYTIREQLGEGGMGVVYVAEQKTPIQRKVALKIIKPGMDSKQVVSRFQQERQTLALMSHTNIAKVIDGGTTESGRPYFAMELVRGIPITEYCDQKKLGLRDRLKLFTTVCQAVQHAHLKGIIHRDLKPSNVMIEQHDTVAVPKVIDFGVAKAVNQKLSEHTVYTSYGQLIGTPMYMSPEQAELSGLDIDTRTDVYSLGVLLYELLTGNTPFDKDEMHKASFDEVRRIIREDEPQRPSDAVSTLQAQALSTVAENRLGDPRKLCGELRGELDWIVMRALEKDRNRRYESASSFAADIERYLIDEPVEACPPSKAYRLQKFTKRNKVFLTTSAIVLIALVAGTGIASWQAVVANEERAQAQLAEEKAKESKEKAEQEAAVSKAVLDFVQEDLLGKASPNETPDPEVKLRTILDRAAAEIKDKFPGQPLVEATLLDTIAQAYQTLGKYKEAETHQQRAVELSQKERGVNDPQALIYSSRLGAIFTDRGRYTEAQELLDKTLKSQQEILGNEHADTLKTMNSLVSALRLLGIYQEAEELAQHALDISRRTLGEEHPDTLISMNNLGLVYWKLKRLEEAEEIFLKTREILNHTLGEDHPSTLTSMNNLAIIFREQRRYSESEKLLLQTLEKRKLKLGLEHPDTIASMHILAVVYFDQKRYEEAVTLNLKTIDLRNRMLGDQHPFTQSSKNKLHYEYSKWTWRLIIAIDPSDRNDKKMLELARKSIQLSENASDWNNLGVALYLNGEYGEAIESLEKADKMLEGEYRELYPFLAMSHWQLENRQTAIQYYKQYLFWFFSNQQRFEDQRFLVEMETLFNFTLEDRQAYAQIELESLKRAVQENPDDYQIVNLLSQAYKFLNDQESTIKACTRMIELKQDDSRAYKRRYRAYALLHQWKPALADCVRFNQLKPHSGQSQYHEALIRVSMSDAAGYQDLCKRMLEHYLGNEDDSRGAFIGATWSVSPSLSEMADEVVAIGIRLSAENPEHYHRRRTLGSSYYRQGKYDLAAQSIELALALNETEARILVWMALCQYQLGHKAAARDWLDRARINWQESQKTNNLSTLLETPLLLEEAEALINQAKTEKEPAPQEN